MSEKRYSSAEDILGVAVRKAMKGTRRMRLGKVTEVDHVTGLCKVQFSGSK